MNSASWSGQNQGLAGSMSCQLNQSRGPWGGLRVSETLDYKIADLGEKSVTPSQHLHQFGLTIAEATIRYAR